MIVINQTSFSTNTPSRIRRVLVVSLFILLGLGTGCKNANEEHRLPSSVVENPATAKKPGDMNDLPVISFDKLEHDFGRILQGEMITFAFRFRNTGKKPLVIARVSSSCGCTIADYPTEALAPEEEGFIKVTFDSNNRRGFQSKTVTVLANTQPNTITLRVKAQVVSSAD